MGNHWRGWRARALLAAGLAMALFGAGVAEAENAGLPAGTDFGEATAMRPREILASEAAGGRQSDIAALGNLLFASPDLFGQPARSAGISCETCHTAGHANQHFLIPGLSAHAGTIDVSNGFFNPPADDHVFNPVRIPSLRGVRYLAPYGRDGRIASLREFTRNVIVGEFGGAEPSARVLDALVAYMQEIDFLPNPRLSPAGTLAGLASAAERRGEALFRKPFAQMGNQSCAACHPPSALFTDHDQHDVASGGNFKTPTLLGLDFRAPYFHDGRYPTLRQAVAHFDRAFALGLSAGEIRDLVAYLEAVGDASEPEEPDSVAVRMTEVETFCRTLDRLVGGRDPATLRLAVNAIDRELRELGEQFPGGDLKPARAATAALAEELRAIEALAKAEDFDDARTRLAAFEIAIGELGPTLETFEAQSLFNPARRSVHYASLKEVEVLRGN